MKKSAIKLMLVMCIVFTTIFACFTVTANAGEYMYVSGASTGAVYLRVAPASESYYFTVNNGTRVVSDGWQRGWDGVGYNHVYVDGYSGWITTDYLSYSIPSYSYYHRAYISGVNNSVYLWSSAYGSDNYGTVPRGATIYVDYNTYENNRVYGSYYGIYGWFTYDYVYGY